MRSVRRAVHAHLLWTFVLAGGFSAALQAGGALAEPRGRNSLARAAHTEGGLNLLEARRLLEATSGSAADLTARPALWDWSNPITAPRVSQAPPAAEPGEQTAQAAPAPEDDTDILDEVSVTATRRPTRTRDVTSTVYTVKKEDFRAQNAQTVTDALQLVPGFFATPALGGVRNAGGVFLRGFDDQRFEVLRDGLSLRRSSNGRNDVSRFDIEDLERIEVLTGGATLRYGSGAIGGIVNLITETPKGPPKLTLSYQTGSYGFNRYSARYGGGDDTFSYSLGFTSLVAFNDYPYSFRLPNSAQFYGPNDTANNPGCIAASGESPGVGLDASGNCLNGGLPNGTSLFGFLRPELGPPITVSGRADSAYNAADTYNAKLVFRPDPSNRITLRLLQQNSKNDDQGPGTYAFGACFGGTNTSGSPNPTFNFERSLPTGPDGRELPCTVVPYVVNTPSLNASLYGLTGIFYAPFNTTFDGRPFAPGQSYGVAEPAVGTINFFRRRFLSQTEAAVVWDWDITPSTTLNSYVYYYRFSSSPEQPNPFLYNSNIAEATGFFNPVVRGGQPGLATTSPGQPFVEGNKFEAQTALNTQLSPGQTLQVGVNYVQDRSFQILGGSRGFFDRAISRTSVFVVDDISFGPELRANLGFRYTYSTQFGSVGTPAAGLRYTPTNWLSLRGNFSYVFQAPNLSDLYAASPPFISNEGLRPESGVTWDAGVDITPVRNLSIQATYFNTYLDGFFGQAAIPSAGGLLFQTQNIGSRYASGIEALVNWQISDQLSLTTSWTNTDARNYGGIDNINESTYPYFYGVQAGQLPFNNWVTNLRYANRGFLVSLVGRYLSGFRRGTFNDFTPASYTLDLVTEIPLTPFFTLTGAVLNLTDTQYELPAFNPQPGTTFRVGGRVTIGG